VNEYNEHNLPADFDDLSKHAPLLDKLRAKGDGFSVPENYFSDATELSVVSCQLSVVNEKGEGFVVPENYFNELAERIISIVNLSIADNRQLKTENLFEVPENYFNEIDALLNTKLALDNLKQDEGFNIPENYFEKLSEKIISHVAVNELSHETDAEIPAGYFDTLADRIVARIAEEENLPAEKIVERGRIIVFAEILKRYSRPLSIAASITLLISVSIWFFNRGNNPQTDHLAKYVPVKQKFIPFIPILPDSDFVAAPENKNIAVVEHSQHNSKRRINPEHNSNVKVQMADVLTQVEQMDENLMADYIHENTAVSNVLQEKPSHEAVSDYILNSNIDTNDLINGINTQTP
jgi:hypothetical protein